MLTATPAIRETDLLPHPEQPGKYLVRATPALQRVTVRPVNTPVGAYLSVLPDGSFEASGDTGEYQTCERKGNRVVFTCLSQYLTGSMALPLIES